MSKEKYKKNDGERLYQLSQKLYILLTDIGKERKRSKADLDNEVITRKQHHRYITDLYVKMVDDTTKIIESEYATIVTDNIVNTFKSSFLFSELNRMKEDQGKHVEEISEKVMEITEEIQKPEVKHAETLTHKPFAGLDKVMLKQ